MNRKAGYIFTTRHDRSLNAIVRGNCRLQTFILLSFLELFLVSCGHRGARNAPATEDKGFQVSAEYEAAVARAARSSSSDEISKVVSNFHEVTLEQSPIHSIGRVSFGSQARVAIIDYKGKVACLFRIDGKYLGPLGENGRGPGKYLTPVSVVFTGREYAIADFTDHRVNLFGDANKLDRSFIYTGQNFSSSNILYDSKARAFYLFGNRRSEGATSAQPNLLNVYDEEGNFLRSGFSFPSRWIPWHLQNYDYSLAASDEEGRGYFMLPFDSVLYCILPAGSTVKETALDLPNFKTPQSALEEDLTQMNSFHSWELGFTPVRAIAIHGGSAFVEYETNDDLRYTIAVTKLGKARPFKVVRTNYLIVGSGSNGSVAFVNNPGGTGGGGDELAYADLIE